MYKDEIYYETAKLTLENMFELFNLDWVVPDYVANVTSEFFYTLATPKVWVWWGIQKARGRYQYPGTFAV